MTQLASPPVCQVDSETFAFPHELLRGCSSALLLFCSGRMGAADGHWVREYGLEDVLCVDWDASTLEPFAAAYPVEWEYVQDDVFDWVECADRKWDIVIADQPSQYWERFREMLPRYAALAGKYVVATLANGEPGAIVVPEAPVGWRKRDEPIWRAEYQREQDEFSRKFWWLVLEREPTIAFDDGPADTTERILDILAAHGTRAVFFVNGKNIAGREHLLERMVAGGHEIGNHGWSHEPMDEMMFDEVGEEVRRTHQAIVEACGFVPTRLRPPYRRYVFSNPAGYSVVELESSLGDYRLTAEEIIAAAREVEGTLWLHDGVEATVEALPAILAGRA